jgi:YgiT-type zinc finger domain-containing protein
MDEGFQEPQSMNCLICRRADLIDGLTLVQFERGEMKYVINYVPARVCPSCGEAYVEEVVAEALLRRAAQISETGVLESVTEYDIPT